MAQVVECLPSKHEALSSNPTAEKNKTKQKEKQPKKRICMKQFLFSPGHRESILSPQEDNPLAV
jgi:hypothetical protein